MEIVYGTGNAAKIAAMKQCLKGLRREWGLKIIGLQDLGSDFPRIEEAGNSPLDNARIKALAYHNILRRPVFSLDSGLYFDGLPDHLQPGLNVRTVGGKRLNDDEMIAYYTRLAADHGGCLTARYVKGLCLVVTPSLVIEEMSDAVSSKKLGIVSAPHRLRVEGFPLDSLTVDLESGQYLYDLQDGAYDKEDAWGTEKGFYEFFRSAAPRLKAAIDT